MREKAGDRPWLSPEKVLQELSLQTEDRLLSLIPLKAVQQG